MSKQHTLLIVDDEPFNLDILQENLEDEGFAVVRADDGPTALEIIESKEHEFSCILLDRMMPNMDGIDVLRALKKSDEFCKIPVVMQTAAASSKNIQEGIEAGAFYYLTKPFEPDLMLAIVNSAVIDYENIRSSTQNKNQIGDIDSMITSLKLEFKTLDEAQRVIGSISKLFPDPDKTIIGLTELVVNAVEHGNLGILYEEKSDLLKNNTWHEEINNRLTDEKYKNRKARIEFNKTDDEIVLTIKDEGNGFDWQSFVSMSTERAYDTHGRGIAMAGMISFDSLEYIGNGNEVKCVTKLSGNGDSELSGEAHE